MTSWALHLVGAVPEPSLAPRGQYAAADADGANWDANAPTSGFGASKFADL